MDQEPAQSEDKTSWDSETIGFGVRVVAPTKRREEGPSRSSTTIASPGAKKRYTIGSFPERSVAAARAEAKELRRRIDLLRRPHEGAEGTPF
jgi:hypothetical protein